MRGDTSHFRSKHTPLQYNITLLYYKICILHACFPPDFLARNPAGGPRHFYHRFISRRRWWYCFVLLYITLHGTYWYRYVSISAAAFYQRLITHNVIHFTRQSMISRYTARVTHDTKLPVRKLFIRVLLVTLKKMCIAEVCYVFKISIYVFTTLHLCAPLKWLD